MPELPEVESLTRKISQLVCHHKVIQIDFFRDNLREPIDKAGFHRNFLQQTIQKVWRRSKYMVWETKEHAAIFHFGMSGIIVTQKSQEPVLKHTHVVFTVEESKKQRHYLHYVDPRRFGLLACCARSELAEHRLFANLGVEPLTTSRLGAHLFAISRSKNSPIKTLLMDAHHIVGIGNIYASESLFLAGISPLNLASRLTMDDCRSLARHCKQVLRRAIEAGGTSFRDFVHPDRHPGYFGMQLKVYQREGEPCRRCGALVARIVQQQRSTFYCPACQRVI